MSNDTYSPSREGYVVTEEELAAIEQRLPKPWSDECTCDVCSVRRRDHERITEIRRRPKFVSVGF